MIEWKTGKFALLIFLVALPFVLFAQDSTRIVPPNLSLEELQQITDKQNSPHARVYTQAMALKDYPTAITALHYLRLEDPESTILRDSLITLYLLTDNLRAATLMCEQSLQTRPQDKYLLEIAANVYSQTGQLERAIEKFTTLYELEGSLYFRYQVTSLQFLLGRYGECGTNIEQMLNGTAIDDAQIHIAWEDGEADISMRAALLNLRGNLLLALNKQNSARKSWREALKIAPDFALPQNNIRALDEENRQRLEAGNDR